jgi:Dolichyl-phosphate-mannose-protein mannosyltransferase
MLALGGLNRQNSRMTKRPVSLAQLKELGVGESGVGQNASNTPTKAHSDILFFLVIAVPSLSLVIYQSQNKLLWYDELFTYYIAQAPSLSKLIEQTQTLDFNPPLSYLLVRGLFHLFPANATVCRIPSMAGFLLCMGCVYSFVRRKLDALWGMVGALFLASSVAYPYAFEARPYGLMLGFLSLALIGWQRIIDERGNRLLGLALLVCGGLGGLLSHAFALPAWMVLIVAELVRARTRQHWDWPVLLALLFPMVAVVTYLPMVHAYAVNYFPPTFQATPRTIIAAYIVIFFQAVFSVFCVTVLGRTFLGEDTFRPQGRFPLSVAEWVALLGFLAIPAIIILYLMHTHSAFIVRYGIAANIAIAILLPLFLAWLSRARHSVAWIAVLVLVVWSLLPISTLIPFLPPSLFNLTARKSGQCEACALANRLAPELPFVDASGLTYIEMDNREDAGFLSRVYYLTDPSASIRYAHANIFEGMQAKKDAFRLRSNVEQYSAFVRQHPTFLVFGTYDYPEDWLLKKLQADGAHMCLLQTVSDPQFKDKQLWQVTFATFQTKACAS